jgi:acetyl-CoA acyltransferase
MCIGIGMGGAVIWENPHHEAYDSYEALSGTTAEEIAK